MTYPTRARLAAASALLVISALCAIAVPAAAFAAPTWTLAPTAGSVVSSSTVVFSATAEETVPLKSWARFSVDGGTWAPQLSLSPDKLTLTATRTFTGMKEGSHTARIWFRTESGLILQNTWSFTSEVPPVIDSVQPAHSSDTPTPTISVRVTDPAGIAGTPVMEVDGSLVAAAWDSGARILSWIPSTPLSNYETHTVEVSALDLRGNAASLGWAFKTHSVPQIVATDCAICHKGFPTEGHPMETVRCFDCHLKLGNLHEWNPDACYDCHEPHPVDYLTQVECGKCHGEKVANGHMVSMLPEHATDYPNFVADCGECHDGELQREHVYRKDRFGQAVVCASCHRSARPAVAEAVEFGIDTCDWCHSIEPVGETHIPRHDVEIDPACTAAGCHVPNLATEHIDVRGLPCLTNCHGANAPQYVQDAVATRNQDCAACHFGEHPPLPPID